MNVDNDKNRTRGYFERFVVAVKEECYVLVDY
jgi:hypothetical protein